MAKGIKYKLSESPLYKEVVCSSGMILRFYFTTEVRQRSFSRRQREYRDQVDDVMSSRYHGIRIYPDEIAAVDLYNRIETGERRIEEILVTSAGDAVRPLTPDSELTIAAVIR